MGGCGCIRPDTRGWGWRASPPERSWKTAFLVVGSGKAGLGRWDRLEPAALAHHRKLNRINVAAGTLEVAIWVLWLALFNWLDSVPAPQQVIASGVVLLVLMHLKHQVETAAIRDMPFRTVLFAPRGMFGTVMEVGGAVGCLALIEDHQYVLAAVALGAGLLIEHVSLLDELRWEVGARDIRRPRDCRWKPPRRREAMLYLTTHFPRIWKRVEGSDWLGRWFNRYAINRAISFVEPRPDPLSTLAGYTSWSSLTDRSYSGRHLPPAASLATANGLKKPPDVNTVADLFKREGAMLECRKSTVLFSWFAQWFTDGFLRTSRELGRDGVRNTLKNESTHEIDLAQLYGRTDKQTHQLRAHDGGLLRSQTINGEEYPEYLCALGEPKDEFSELPKPVRFDALEKHQQDLLFAMGSDVTNFGVVAFNVLFLREHNCIARRLGAENPKWHDEQVFQTARAVLIVVLLKIVIEEYIHHISPAHFRPRLAPASFPNEPWYRPNRMAIEFNLLYRWHSLVPSTFLLDGTDLQIDDVLFDTNRLTSKGLGPFMAAASGQPAGRIGLFNTDPWFIKRVEVPSIEQARKVDLCSYNDYRRLCRFPPVRSLEEISSDEGTWQRLRDVYGHVDNVEFYVGLFAEDRHPNGVLPPLMATMVAFDAFSQALTNPLLAPRIYNEETFSPAGWEIVRKCVRLSDLVNRKVPSGSEYFVSLTRRDFERT